MPIGPARTAPATIALLLAVAWCTGLVVAAGLWHQAGTTVVGATSSGARYVLHTPDRTLLQQDGVVAMVGASIPLLASLLVAWCLRWGPEGHEGALHAVAWVVTGALALASLLAAFAFGPLLMPAAGLLVAACASGPPHASGGAAPPGVGWR